MRLFGHSIETMASLRFGIVTLLLASLLPVGVLLRGV